ncbi:hypothetical protein SLS60_001206 [Paraconiothyrium brasiliense]|uniref:Inner kinetochore subunit AME1 domain-containing protein n=1 Tax=Paraconiothyrium brasiliense TaxID=300254 RepID=A0ABR3S8K2_9PLEO
MAPIGMQWTEIFNRAEREARRQQRKRGAGTTSAITDFNFNFSFGPSAAKQSSVPPQRTKRTPTPSRQTPRTLNSSAKRHRSASVHRSSSVRRHITPKALVTPQLGKRKRGSQDAQALGNDEEPDELSPGQYNETHSTERARRVVGTVAPIHEEADDEPDELSMVLEGPGSGRKHAADAINPTETPTLASVAQERTPSLRVSAAGSVRSRMSTQRSNSTEAPPETPSIIPNGRLDHSSAQLNRATPAIALEEEEEDEDELTPAPASVTPRVVGKQLTVASVTQEEDEVDELSSPAQPAHTGTTPTSIAPKEQLRPSLRQEPDKLAAVAPAKRGRPKRVVAEENEVQSTPAATKPRRRKTSLDVQEAADAEDSVDELSPEVHRTRKPAARRKQSGQPMRRQEEPVEISSAEEESEAEEPIQEDEPASSVLPAPQGGPVKRVDSKPARKRPKFSGPKQAISVMRIKGSTVRGITVADTTRTILEENIDHQVQRMATKMQTTEDSSRRKKLRGHINLALAFKESLVEKLMDLQDANDTLSAGFKKRKLLRKDNLELRKEILRIQNNRHEIALEMDDERAVYDAEKATAEAKSQLSANMFEIQAAIQKGRERARREGREDEGPERPLSMLIEKVGRQVGSVGGGLLASLQHFNEGLERAAGWLEGRA